MDATLDERCRPAAGGVVLWGHRVLVIRKRANGELRLPKGRIEPGEDAAVTALRETSEETGFADLRIGALLGTRQLDYVLTDGRVSREITWYRVSAASLTRRPRNRKDARRFAVLWLDVTTALRELTFDDERERLAQAVVSASTSAHDEVVSQTRSRLTLRPDGIA